MGDQGIRPGAGQQGVRFFEEAVELAQAAGVEREMAHKLVDYKYDRSVGKIGQEFGGVGVMLLLLGYAAGYDADECEREETKRVLGIGPDHFKARDEEKNVAGFDVIGRK